MSAATQFRGVNPWLQTYWDWCAVGNFVGGGTGTGFLVAVAIVAMLGAPSRLLAAIGLAFVGAGLTCVWLEIGRPWRALNVFFNPRTSWMSREAALAPILFAVGGLGVLFAAPAAMLAAAVLGLGFLYCQARILQAAKGIPAWRQQETIPLIFATGMTEGFGMFVLAAPLAGLEPVWAAVILLALLAFRFEALRRYATKLQAGAAPKPAVRALEKHLPRLRLLGHALPAALLVTGLLMPLPFAAMLCWATGGLAAALAGWRLKYAIIVEAAYTQGYAVERAPARTPGASGPGGRPGW
jgi:phenylacetyl-CoA:acceptor oxidoreductase subunit 2